MLTQRSMALALSMLFLSLGAQAADFTLPSFTFPTGITNDGTHLWISSDAFGRGFAKVDPLTGAVLGSIQHGAVSRDIVWDGGSRIIVSEIDGYVSEVDMGGAGVASSFELPFRGGAIAWDGSTLFVGDTDHPYVVTATRGGAITGSFVPGGLPPDELRPEGMVYDSERGTLWVIELLGSNIHEISTSGTILRTCASPYNPGPFGLGGITLLGSTLYIVEPAGGDPNAGAHVFSLERSALVCTPPLTTVAEVSIDVLAGAIAARSRGRIAVAIATDGTFDAAAVDASTLRFGPTGTEATVLNTWLEDVDSDGDLDRVAQFGVVESGIGCSTETVVVAGSTTSGGAFRGSDSVTVVGCR